ncbi:MAG: hypothetical protein F4Y26_05820 [Gammaproteobacteria bacterium]|nr:hypothetical protein [Gammaproteobacteria bacterium]
MSSSSIVMANTPAGPTIFCTINRSTSRRSRSVTPWYAALAKNALYVALVSMNGTMKPGMMA